MIIVIFIHENMLICAKNLIIFLSYSVVNINCDKKYFSNNQ
ncbi:hypothetical protein HMPREF9970_0083 [Lachnoanaerobaculum saburreum F0468]|uniref:Uncharacterized protein n=2 Tax=Lachnoanaerobaculum saburreum TaxID=467210 RepID=I0R896_9FIRM|nr:hypothetical protein HMPREF0381_2568 [Lachnoanaerobaculum saburreum DSM 3986]EIC95904.1 hypothetical protein HMPREF9970_0083 [Lachnoanaerobaculum saburreum F0468]